jgi:hypothetical protein
MPRGWCLSTIIVYVQVNADVTGAAAQSWLAPRSKRASAHQMRPNTIIIMLPYAALLSKIRFWNYFKNPERGVCEFDILLDDSLIFSGYLGKAGPRVEHQTVMFSNDPAEIAAEEGRVLSCAKDVPRAHITLIDERKVRHRGESLRDKRAAPSERPLTAVVS